MWSGEKVLNNREISMNEMKCLYEGVIVLRGMKRYEV